MKEIVELIGVEPQLMLNKSVAIVGNSPKILNEDRGEEIDSHDEVIRFNGAWIKEFEKNVGKKTTIKFIGIDIQYLFTPPYRRPSNKADESDLIRLHNGRIMLDEFSDAKFITFSAKDKVRAEMSKQYDTESYLKQLGAANRIWTFKESGAGSAMSYFEANKDFEFLGLSSRLNFGGPRTGIKAVIRMVLSGIKPDLYGFDIDTKLKFANHYYDSITNEEISTYKDHDIHGEMVVLIEMHDKNLINIVS